MSTDRDPDEVQPRPSRSAALVVGRSLEDVRSDAEGGDVVETPRGFAILGSASMGLDYTDHPDVMCFSVVHFLDDGEFRCTVQHGDELAVFSRPARSGSGIDRIDNVEGETEPRAITRKLGLPEPYLFP